MVINCGWSYKRGSIKHISYRKLLVDHGLKRPGSLKREATVCHCLPLTRTFLGAGATIRTFTVTEIGWNCLFTHGEPHSPLRKTGEQTCFRVKRLYMRCRVSSATMSVGCIVRRSMQAARENTQQNDVDYVVGQLGYNQ